MQSSTFFAYVIAYIKCILCTNYKNGVNIFELQHTQTPNKHTYRANTVQLDKLNKPNIARETVHRHRIGKSSGGKQQQSTSVNRQQ